ncbi:hypothetical protein ACE3MQ_16615 [Paenibacillus lentus]
MFFDANKNWIEYVLKQGKEAGDFIFGITPAEQAQMLVAFVQGAQLLSRSSGDIGYYDMLISNYMASLSLE